MVSGEEMMLDLGWRNMQSKRWRGVVFSVVLVASATAQESAIDPPSETNDEVGQGASESAEPSTPSEPTRSEPAPQAVDTYTPTERISEDRSVSFPVDI